MVSRIVWTVLPAGMFVDGLRRGQLRASVVVSPRLIPDRLPSQPLGAIAVGKLAHEFIEWPKHLSSARITLKMDGQRIPAELVGSSPDNALWQTLIDGSTLLSGFQFKDMSAVNLRSYSVRNTLGFVRRHYGAISARMPDRPPSLLRGEANSPVHDLLNEVGSVRAPSIAVAPRLRFTQLVGQEGGHIENELNRLVFGNAQRGAMVRGVDGREVRSRSAIRALPPDRAALGDIANRFSSDSQYDFYQANRFYTRPENREGHKRRPDFREIKRSPKEPEREFHRIIASLVDQPRELSCLLGIVIDVAFAPPESLGAVIRAGGSASGVLHAEIAWPSEVRGLHASDCCPGTAWLMEGKRFCTLPRPGGSDHKAGMLQLAHAHDRHNEPQNSMFAVYQVDPDGSAMKTANAVLSAERMSMLSTRKGATSSNEERGVAALRSGGIGVSRHGRAVLIAEHAASSQLKNTSLEGGPEEARRIILYSEDVLRGYRVDIHDSRWFSLCSRVAECRIGSSGAVIRFGPDEGYVSGASTTSKEGSSDYYLHESLFRWTGWSLCAKRPGRTIRAYGPSVNAIQEERVEDVKAQASKGTGIVTTYQAQPGTLPRLRFGRRYRVRARLVDLAGNSLSYDDPSLAGDLNASEEVLYGRFEPVDPPAIVPRSRLSEGESVERMVIRSNWNVDATTYLSSERFRQVVDGSAFEYGLGDPREGINERHVVPPRVSQLLAETHGLFDSAFGSVRSAAIRSQYDVAIRESGSLFAANVELVSLPGTSGITTTSLPPAQPSEANPTGERLVGGQYVVCRDEAIVVPYLPDDLSGGIAIRGVPGVTEPRELGENAEVVKAPSGELVVRVRFKGEWPAKAPLRIRIAELIAGAFDWTSCRGTYPDPTPKWSDSARVLTVFLKKGEIARLRYSSWVLPKYLERGHLGMPQWSPTANDRAAINELAGIGCHWMVTPYRRLTLVHATQQPVCEPRFVRWSVQRPLGATYVDFDPKRTVIGLHGPSTGGIQIFASWREWIDDPNDPRPHRLSGKGELSELRIPENYKNEFAIEEIQTSVEASGQNVQVHPYRHEFGDSKFRLIRYRIKAASRFREYFPAALWENENDITRIGPEIVGDRVVQGGDGDPGTPVLFKPGGVPDGIVIPNSARPPSPRPIYVIPAFRWERKFSADKLQFTSTRYGNTLRVYLERPWFTSGDGELLGVVLAGEGVEMMEGPVFDKLKPYVTQWGQDPLFKTAPPISSLKATAFANRVTSGKAALEELMLPLAVAPIIAHRVEGKRRRALSPTGHPVFVVGHRVQWDDDRKLWFSDIEVATGKSYFPFIRLALVRYQPQSIPGAHISRVVLAEFAQLLPRRRVSFTRLKDTCGVAVRGIVPEYGSTYYRTDISGGSSPSTELGRNRFEVALQTRDSDLDSDLAWKDDSSMKPVSGPGNPSELAKRSRGGSKGRPFVAVPIATLETDLPVWQGKVTLPAQLKKPARLVIREFERYCADRPVRPDQARAIEERLVYAEFFPLG